MAQKRMFALSIVDTDFFLDMPVSAQALYFHLSMRADDDGFIANSKKIQREVSCSDDDLRHLAIKRFILTFESGVIVIKHWKIHNLIQKDRYKPTLYIEEKSQLFVKKDGAYTDHPGEGVTPCIQNVSKTGTQVSSRLGIGLGLDKISTTAVAVVDPREEDADGGGDDNPNDKINFLRGELGKGVVKLTENQIDDLLKQLGNIEVFDYYVAKLASFILEKNAKVKNHYQTILKWYKEDCSVKPGNGR